MTQAAWHIVIHLHLTEKKLRLPPFAQVIAKCSVVVEDDFKLLILQPPPPECLDYRCAPPQPVDMVLEVKFRVSSTAGK